MAALSEQRIEARYRRMFGRVAGYLPKDRAVVNDFHAALKPVRFWQFPVSPRLARRREPAPGRGEPAQVH